VAARPVRVAIAEAQGLMCAEEVVTERPLPGFDQAAIDGYAVRSVDVLGVGSQDEADDGENSTENADDQQVSLPVMGNIEAGARDAEPAAATTGRTGADRSADADPRRCGAAVAVDRRRQSGCGVAARCARVPTSAAPATTFSPMTWRCGQARSLARRRSACWPPSGANASWSILGHGCR
jgi:hypothetical protein